MSLAKIDEKLGQKRRALADAVSARGELFAKLDAVSDAIDALQAKESLSAEEASDLEAKLTAHKAEKRALTAKSDEIAALESAVRDLESERTAREDQARMESRLGDSQERKAPAERPVAFDADVRVAGRSAEQDDHDIASFFRNTFIAADHKIPVSAVNKGAAGAQFRNDRLSAAMDTSSNSHILPLNYQPRIIELLRARTVIRQMQGLRTLPLQNGNLRIPRQTGGSTAAYAAELANIAASDITTDDINLSAKKLTVLVVQSGELMRQASPSSDALIRDDMIQQLARKEDATFIRATQSSTVPGGLKYFADASSSTQVITANQTLNVANVTVDIGKLILALQNADSPMLNPYFLMAPRAQRYLMDLRDGNGNLAFPEVMRGELRGFPYLVTSQIPINLTVSSVADCTEVYLVDASEFIVADAPTFDVRVSLDGAYYDGSAVQSLLSKDAVGFRLIVEHDTAIRHPKSVAYLSKCIWA